MLVGALQANPAARRARDKAELHQVRLVHVLDGVRVLVDGRSERFQTRGAAVKLFNERAEQTAVGVVQPQFVDVHLLQSVARVCKRDGSVALDGGKIAHALQQTVADARRAAGTAGDFAGGFGFDGDAERLCRAGDDLCKFVGGVHFEPAQNAEAVSQRRAEHARLGRCADEREML